jgi:hypothetical protein
VLEKMRLDRKGFGGVYHEFCVQFRAGGEAESCSCDGLWSKKQRVPADG